MQRPLNVTSKIFPEIETIIDKNGLGNIDSPKYKKKQNEIKTFFSGLISHEFQTPLSCILSSASLIAMYSGADQQNEREKHIERIAASVNDLNELLNDFLFFTELEQKTINTSFATFNIPDYFNQIIDQMHGPIRIKHQVIEYRHDGKKIIGQSKKILKHILLNLLSNASKYSREGSVILLHSSLDKGTLTVIIKDSGIGIPEADQKKLFTKFFRASNVNGIQGTGLGLTLVKKYVKLLNGSIKFASKINEGTVFKITIPQNSHN